MEQTDLSSFGDEKYLISIILYLVWGTLLVAQLVEALRYKPASRVFDFRWCRWNF
jgi:hypothetical protein